MKLNFKEFFNSTPKVIDVAIALTLFSLGLGFASAIALSNVAYVA